MVAACGGSVCEAAIVLTTIWLLPPFWFFSLAFKGGTRTLLGCSVIRGQRQLFLQPPYRHLKRLRCATERRNRRKWSLRRLPQIPFCLSAEPRFGCRIRQQSDVDGHISRNCRAPIQNARQLSAGHAKAPCDLLNRHSFREEFPQQLARVRWVKHACHNFLLVIILIVHQDRICPIAVQNIVSAFCAGSL